MPKSNEIPLKRFSDGKGMEENGTGNFEKARNTMFSRLISCIVNEHIAEIQLLQVSQCPLECRRYQGRKTILWAYVSKDPPPATGFWIQLIGCPVVATPPPEHLNSSSKYQIVLLDPSDFEFPIVILSAGKECQTFKPLENVDELVSQIAEWRNESPISETYSEFLDQIENCISHQAKSYDGRTGIVPSISNSTFITWEQSLIEGSPAHPMNKLRYGIPPICPIPPTANLSNPSIIFYAMDRGDVMMSGNYEAPLSLLREKCGDEIHGNEVLIPVHFLQVPLIQKYFPNARQLSLVESSQATSSTRTVLLPSLPHLNFKLSLGVIMGSEIRTIPPYEIRYGQMFSPAVMKFLVEDSKLLLVAQEIGGISAIHPNPQVSAQLGCILRQNPESSLVPVNEKVIVCAALFERTLEGDYIVNRIFHLETKAERVGFLANYVQLYLRAFIPPLVKYGFMWEAHAQNTLARVKMVPGDGEKWEVVGWVIRDLSGIRAHRETLESGIGFKIPSSSEEVPGVKERWDVDPDRVYRSAYTNFFQLHLYRLVRALDLHYSGEGWKIVQSELDALLPSECEARERFLVSTTVKHRRQLLTILTNRELGEDDRPDAPNLITCEPLLKNFSLNGLKTVHDGDEEGFEDVHLEGAQNSVFSRIISCMVNEGIGTGIILHTIQVPVECSQYQHPTTIKWASIVKCGSGGNESGTSFQIWVQLKGMPLVGSMFGPFQETVLKITLLDPEDSNFPILIRTDEKEGLRILKDLKPLMDCLDMWIDDPPPPPSMLDELSRQLLNCMDHQRESYGRQRPTLSLNSSKALDWEQSLISGHPCHPLHKARYGIPPIGPVPSTMDLVHPTIYFIRVPKTKVTMSGDYESLLEPLLKKLEDLVDPIQEIVIPVHEIQLPVLETHFPEACVLPYTEVAHSLSSIRTVVLESLPRLNVKLSVGLLMGSVLRTIHPMEITYGHILKDVLRKILEDSSLVLADELGGISLNHEDPNISALCGSILRRDPESMLENPINEKLIVCAALVEKTDTGDFRVNSLFHLESKADRVKFLENYVHLLLGAFVPLIVNHGFLFEAHAQNTVARVELKEGKWAITDFMIRDLSGIEIHRETLETSTGQKIEPSWRGTPYKWDMTEDRMYNYAFYAIFQLHLHRVIRALDLHYSGEGWKVVRNELENILPLNSEARRRWLEDSTVKIRHSLLSKLVADCGDFVPVVPNLILHERTLCNDDNSQKKAQ